jgi:hypothetical protein
LPLLSQVLLKSPAVHVNFLKEGGGTSCTRMPSLTQIASLPHHTQRKLGVFVVHCWQEVSENCWQGSQSKQSVLSGQEGSSPASHVVLNLYVQLSCKASSGVQETPVSVAISIVGADVSMIGVGAGVGLGGVGVGCVGGVGGLETRGALLKTFGGGSKCESCQ